MSDQLPAPAASNSFERIKRVNESGAEFWSSRDFAQVLGYTDYRNFEAVVEKARTACFNSGHRMEDHCVDITEMVPADQQCEPRRRCGVCAGLSWPADNK